MSADTQHATYKRPALEFKSSTFTVPVLVLTNNDLTVITNQLQEKIQQAPEFFRNSPLLIDLQALTSQNIDIDFTSLIETLRQQKLIPVGLRGGSEEQNTSALSQGISVLSMYHTGSTVKTSQQNKITPEIERRPDADESTATKMITHPIRSGQRVYASGDLVILAQVSAGAEILAEGNIHVYGTLRGRALAGVSGNSDCRIFCSDLQAELVSIAGHYKISEDLDETVEHKPVQIYLKDRALIIKNI